MILKRQKKNIFQSAQCVTVGMNQELCVQVHLEHQMLYQTLLDFIRKVDLILIFSSTDEDKGSSNKKFLYLTFDDGPNFGSHVVLDAFKSAGSLQIAREVFK